MPFLRPTLPRQAESIASRTRLAARQALSKPNLPFPVIAKCPAPTCVCAETPPGLDIDHSKDLSGTMVPYAQHVLISSGQSDWKSKIENEKDVPGWGKLTAKVKAALGRHGQYHDPYNNVLISTSSFQTDTTEYKQSEPSAEVLLFPSFRRIANVSPDNDESVTDLIRHFLLPETLHQSYASLSESEKQLKTRPSNSASFRRYHANKILNPTILICSHNSRDTRCGTLGPLLRDEFARQLELNGFSVTKDVFRSEPSLETSRSTVNIGLISHIGGHKWAGNVIMYIPEHHRIPADPKDMDDPTLPSNSSMGIWYGRVEPHHVEGIISETLVKGKVIKELFRGGIDRGGQILRL